MSASRSPRKTAKPSGGKASSKKGSKATRSSQSKKKTTGKPKDKCFVISPFGGWNDDYYTEIFQPSIKAAGLEPARADDLFRSSNIVHDIWHLVSSARVLLADLTGKNANVFYELGLAHAAQKPVLLLTQTLDDIPFDLQALRVITYDVEHPEWGKVLINNIKQGLKEMLESPERSVLPTFLLEGPGEQPQVSPEEARMLSLEQQVDSLRTEIRETRVADRRASRIPANEAQALMMHFIEEGLPRGMIVRRLSDLGAPRSWIDRELDRQMRKKKAKT
jgi:hypothetical protein